MSTPVRTIGSYVLGPLIGRGGTGEVYAAEPRGGGPAVAIKLLRSHVAGDPGAVAAFRAEAERTRAISHPNVVRVLDFDCDRDGFYLVMDRLDGETLAARLARGPVAEPIARRLGAAIADGLAAAHDLGIVHRDLKPGNVVLVAPGGEPCIVDFGIARYFVGDAPATTTSRIGTPAYMAPEQLTGGLVAPCVDVWALGVVLYELVTGSVPFDAVDGRCPQLFEAAPRPSKVSPGYAALVAACLEREPAARPPSVREVARALRDVDGVGERITEDVGPILQAPLVPEPRRPRRAPVLVAAACLVIAGAVVAWRLAVPSTPPPAAAVVPPSAPASVAVPVPPPAPVEVARPTTRPVDPKPVTKHPSAPPATRRPSNAPPTRRAGETLD